VLKAYWGLAQLENLPAVYNAEPDRMPDDVNLDGIRTMVDASGIQVHYGATRQPTYYPGILVFKSDDDFISTLGHELIHATGHKGRREEVQRQSVQEPCSVEKLVAEPGGGLAPAERPWGG
jgi:antirestriction protein ArdC